MKFLQFVFEETIEYKNKSQNIHKQDFTVADKYKPKYCFKS